MFYVALTRARNRLYVSYPLRYYRYAGGFSANSRGGTKVSRKLYSPQIGATEGAKKEPREESPAAIPPRDAPTIQDGKAGGRGLSEHH